MGFTLHLKFRASVHRECGQNGEGGAPADIWWPASLAAELCPSLPKGISEWAPVSCHRETDVLFSEFLHYFARIRFLHLSEGVSGT